MTDVQGSSTTFAGAISGTGGLTLNGVGGTLILSSANTYSGATTVNNGTLQAGVVSVAGTSGAFGLNSAVTLANTAGATLALNGFNTQIGSLSGGGSTGGNITLGSGTLTDVQSTTTTYAGVISGTGGLTLNGSGTLALITATNLYGGGTILSGTSTILVGNNGNENQAALGTGTVTLNPGTTLHMEPGSTGSTFSFANNFSVNGGTIIGEDGVQRIATGGGATFAVGASSATLEATWSGKDVFVDGLISGSGPIMIQHGPTGGRKRDCPFHECRQQLFRHSDDEHRRQRDYSRSR